MEIKCLNSKDSAGTLTGPAHGAMRTAQGTHGLLYCGKEKKTSEEVLGKAGPPIRINRTAHSHLPR
jgi:hypothetical protein